MTQTTPHFGVITTCLITVLFVLGAVLPIFGIASAMWPLWRTLRLADKRTIVRHAIYAKYPPLINAAKAAGDLEREQELQAAQTRELEAKDKTGTAIGDGGGISFNWRLLLAEDELKKLTYSLVWVCAGLVSGTAASIWSFLGSL